MTSLRKNMGFVTLHDVADAAAVSAITVSRVVNGKGRVSEETRRAVQKAIDALNYKPNVAARHLAAGSFANVGLLYSNPSSSYLSQFLIGALEGAKASGCHLHLEGCASDAADDQATAVRRLVSADIEGIILPPPVSESDAALAELSALPKPIVTVGRVFPFGTAPNVRINDFEAAKAMTAYLIGLGHRRIGFIKGHPGISASTERFLGFVSALNEAGIGVEETPVEQGYFTYRSGFSAAERLLGSKICPSAIFASNDDMASASINAAQRHGLVVPDDISVVGFDDTEGATSIWPELTTIKQPVAAMATAACEILLHHAACLRQRRHPHVFEKVLQHQLVVRGSAGAVPIHQPSRRQRHSERRLVSS